MNEATEERGADHVYRPLAVPRTLSVCSASSLSTRSSPAVLLLRSRPRVSSDATRPSTLARTLQRSVCFFLVDVEEIMGSLTLYSCHPRPGFPDRCWLRPELLLPSP